MAYTTINKSSEHFNTKLYTGNGSTQTITGVGFQPDFMWIKERSGTSSHALINAVSGINKKLMSNSTDVESTETNYITAVSNDGFSVGQNNGINQSGITNVAWNWKANGSGSANTDGSITSTVSANTTAGFSIVSYTGTGSLATVGHGLSTAPSMIIIKNRSVTKPWQVGHKSLGFQNGIYLNETSASQSDNGAFNSTNPTTSVFTIETSSYVNTSGHNYIAYCFAEKTGYSKFGSYTGNGNANGTFVYTGFKPAFVLAKKTNEANTSWIMLDDKRLTSFNPIEVRMFANLSSAEDDIDADYCDFVSNGFKIRKDDNNINDANDSYIYMAFAEAPLVGTNNVPCTAR